MRQSIESVINQTYKNWELIIIDDCSSDNTPEIAKEYANQDNRIKYYRNETNLKLPRGLNRGFSLSKGEYLTWTSDDNLYLPTAIEKMVNVLMLKTANFVFASYEIIDENGKQIEKVLAKEGVQKRLVGSNCVGACFLYTRNAYNAIGEYDPELTLVEDFDYWQRVYAKYGAETIEEYLYQYRWHESSLTSTMKKQIFFQNLKKMLIKNKGLFLKLDYEEKYYYYSALHKCYNNLEIHDPNAFRTLLYRVLYLVRTRLPMKLKRIIHKQ